MEKHEQITPLPVVDLQSEDGAAISVEIVGYAAVFAAVLAAVIAAGPQIGELVVSGIQTAIAAVTGGA